LFILLFRSAVPLDRPGEDDVGNDGSDRADDDRPGDEGQEEGFENGEDIAEPEPVPGDLGQGCVLPRDPDAGPEAEHIHRDDGPRIVQQGCSDHHDLVQPEQPGKRHGTDDVQPEPRTKGEEDSTKHLDIYNLSVFIAIANEKPSEYPFRRAKYSIL